MKPPKPIGNLVLVKPIDQVKEKEKGGILLPDYAENVMPDRGKVIATGSKVTEVKVGDTIVFDRVRVDNFKDKAGKFEYLFVPENLIKAIIG